MRYFLFDEFDSPDLEGSGEKMDSDFLEKLDQARSVANIPFKINSGYRTEEHNKKVGGKANSSHLRGYAADIHVNDSRSRSIILTALMEVGFNRFGIGNTFIHVDNDPEKKSNVIWVY